MTFEGKICSFFTTSKKQRFIFLATHLRLMFIEKKDFFQEYTEMELKKGFWNGKNKTLKHSNRKF